MSLQLLTPKWPAPKNVHAFVTTRKNGYSNPPYDSLNLGLHVDDVAEHVIKNRHKLTQEANLPSEPVWLNQTHSTRSICIDKLDAESVHDADASFATQSNKICTVLTADCLPILVCNKQGTQVAAIHAGWRGLSNGIIEHTLARFTDKPKNILVYLGPAIGPSSFEVGVEVLHRFSQYHPDAPEAFTLKKNGKYHADLYLLASQHLKALDIENIYGGTYDTFKQKDKFFSYRRDGETGRMASLIWFD